jgi:hypothetical protein
MGQLFTLTSSLHGMMSEVLGTYWTDGTIYRAGDLGLAFPSDVKGTANFELLWNETGVGAFSSIYSERVNIGAGILQDWPVQFDADDAKKGTVENTFAANGHIKPYFLTDKSGHWQVKMTISGKIVDMALTWNAYQGGGAYYQGYHLLGNGHAEVLCQIDVTV